MTSEANSESLRELSRNSLVAILILAIGYALLANSIYGIVPPFVLIEFPVCAIAGFLALRAKPQQASFFVTAISTFVIAIGIAAALDSAESPTGSYFIEAGITLLATFWVVCGVKRISHLKWTTPAQTIALLSAVSVAISILFAQAAARLGPFLVAEPTFGPIIRSIGVGAAWYLYARDVMGGIFFSAFLAQAAFEWQKHPFDLGRLILGDWVFPLPLRIVVMSLLLPVTGAGYLYHFVVLVYKAAIRFVTVSVPELIVVGVSYLLGTAMMLLAHYLLFRASSVVAAYLTALQTGRLDWYAALISFGRLIFLIGGGLFFYASVPLALCVVHLDGSKPREWYESFWKQIAETGYPLYVTMLAGFGCLSGFILALPAVNAFTGFGPYSLFCALVVVFVTLICAIAWAFGFGREVAL